MHAENDLAETGEGDAGVGVAAAAAILAPAPTSDGATEHDEDGIVDVEGALEQGAGELIESPLEIDDAVAAGRSDEHEQHEGAAASAPLPDSEVALACFERWRVEVDTSLAALHWAAISPLEVPTPTGNLSLLIHEAPCNHDGVGMVGMMASFIHWVVEAQNKKRSRLGAPKKGRRVIVQDGKVIYSLPTPTCRWRKSDGLNDRT